MSAEANPEEGEEPDARPDPPKSKIDVVVGAAREPTTSDIKSRREGVAGWLAWGTLLLLALMSLIPIVALVVGADGGLRAAELAKDASPAVTTLLGIAFGFYFSEKRHDG